MQYPLIVEWTKDWLGITDKGEDERIGRIVDSVVQQCSAKHVRVRTPANEDFDYYCRMISMYAAPDILQTYNQKESYNRLATEMRREFVILDGLEEES